GAGYAALGTPQPTRPQGPLHQWVCRSVALWRETAQSPSAQEAIQAGNPGRSGSDGTSRGLLGRAAQRSPAASRSAVTGPTEAQFPSPLSGEGRDSREGRKRRSTTAKLPQSHPMVLACVGSEWVAGRTTTS